MKHDFFATRNLQQQLRYLHLIHLSFQSVVDIPMED